MIYILKPDRFSLWKVCKHIKRINQISLDRNSNKMINGFAFFRGGIPPLLLPFLRPFKF